MADFDYNAPADLFPARSKKGNRPFGYRRFETAAEAIRYAIEVMPTDFLPGAVLGVEEERGRIVHKSDSASLLANQQVLETYVGVTDVRRQRRTLQYEMHLRNQ